MPSFPKPGHVPCWDDDKREILCAEDWCLSLPDLGPASGEALHDSPRCFVVFALPGTQPQVRPPQDGMDSADAVLSSGNPSRAPTPVTEQPLHGQDTSALEAGTLDEVVALREPRSSPGTVGVAKDLLAAAHASQLGVPQERRPQEAQDIPVSEGEALHKSPQRFGVFATPGTQPHVPFIRDSSTSGLLL